MQFLKDLNTFHIDGKEIPCIAASGAPDDHYPGATGVLYMDSSTGKLYLCTDANTIQKRYSWRIVGDVDTTEVRQAVESYFAQNMIDAAGLTSEEKNLMLALFKAVPYTSDVSATMKSLEAIWNSGAGGDEGGDAPGVTYYAVTYNLTSVTADSTPASVVSGGSLTVNLTPDTNAVLGEVTVIMGGVDVTADVYSNGKISISSVTGDVVITAVATVASHTQVEYLQSVSATGAGPGIVTNYSPAPTDLVDCEFSFSGNSGWAYIFCWSDVSATGMLITRADNVAGRTSYTRRSGYTFGGTMNDSDPDFVMPTTAGIKYRFVESEPGVGVIYDADGNALVALTDENAGTCKGGAKVGFFSFIERGSVRPNSASGNIRLHSFKIKNVYGETTLDIIPVLDADGTPCLYDRVSGEYYYNNYDGEGTVTAGGAV